VCAAVRIVGCKWRTPAPTYLIARYLWGFGEFDEFFRTCFTECIVLHLELKPHASDFDDTKSTFQLHRFDFTTAPMRLELHIFFVSGASVTPPIRRAVSKSVVRLRQAFGRRRAITHALNHGRQPAKRRPERQVTLLQSAMRQCAPAQFSRI